MKKLLILGVCLVFFTPVFAKSPESPVGLESAPTAPLSIDTLIHESAVKYGVNEGIMRKTLICESHLNPRAVGDGGNSFGLAQIHLPSHPEITKEEALDPVFATDYIAHEFSLGRAWMWSCWRQLRFI